MKLEDARQAYYDFSGKVSDITRTLSLAGIGLIWVFKIDSKDGPHVPHELIPPAFALILALSADYLHYVVATVIWGTYQRYKEKSGVGENAEILAPAWFNWPVTFFLFPLKIVFVCTAYVYLLGFLWAKLT